MYHSIERDIMYHQSRDTGKNVQKCFHQQGQICVLSVGTLVEAYINVSINRDRYVNRPYGHQQRLSVCPSTRADMCTINRNTSRGLQICVHEQRQTCIPSIGALVETYRIVSLNRDIYVYHQYRHTGGDFQKCVHQQRQRCTINRDTAGIIKMSINRQICVPSVGTLQRLIEMYLPVEKDM